MKTLFITGASGLWGRFLFTYFSANPNYSVYGTYNTSDEKISNNKIHLDITDFEKTKNILKAIMPDIIIHTAAISKVKICAENRFLADKVNIKATENITEWCAEYNKKLIFFSTDMIYNSADESILFAETDAANPSNYYAETKLKAEEVIQNIFNNYIILRVALSYGHGDPRHKSFSDWLYDNLKNGQNINLFINQWRTPIYIKDGAKFIDRLITLNKKNLILNFGGIDKVNRVMFGTSFAKVFKLNLNLINKVKVNSSDYSATASINSAMNISKIIEITHITPHSIEENFFDLHTTLKSE